MPSDEVSIAKLKSLSAKYEKYAKEMMEDAAKLVEMGSDEPVTMASTFLVRLGTRMEDAGSILKHAFFEINRIIKTVESMDDES